MPPPKRILILDGAMGTMIQRHHSRKSTFAASAFADWHTDVKGNNDLLSLTQAEIICDIHRAYLEAGADIIETNTFNSTTISQADYEMQALRGRSMLSQRSWRAQLRMNFRQPERPRFVAGILGPTSRTASLSPDVNDPGARNVTFDRIGRSLYRIYRSAN